MTICVKSVFAYNLRYRISIDVASDSAVFAGFQFMKESRLDIARDYVGVVGRFDFAASDCSSLYYTHLPSEAPFQLHDCDAPSQCWSAQVLRPDSPRIGHTGDSFSGPISTWAGTIWYVPDCYGIGEISALQRILASASRCGDFDALCRVEGDFVAVVVASEKVVLIRGLTSTIPLFYKVRKKTVSWSTNFMHLVEDPINDISFDNLAYISWGGNRLPYPGIDTVSQGEAVILNARGIENVQFDDYATIENREKPKSLLEWSETARGLLLAAVAKRARRFHKIGLLLSGGIDSCALAKCLVDVGADVHCYHWASPTYSPADESPYALRVTDMLGIPVTTIDIGRDLQASSAFLDPEWRFEVPYNHPLYRWWKESICLAKPEVDCLMTGRFGGSFHLGIGIRPPKGCGFIEGMKYVWNSLSLPIPTRQLVVYLIPSLINLSFCRSFFPDYDPEDTLLTMQREGAFTLGETAAADGRRVDHYSDRAKQAIIASGNTLFEDSMQVLALDTNDLRPAGLVSIAPYLDKELRSFTKSIPDMYRCYPFAGQLIDKPVLRLAFMDQLPSKVIRHNYQQFYAGILQRYCLNNREFLRTIFNSESLLVKYGVIDLARMSRVLEDQRILRSCSGTIIVNFMVELWLRSLADIATS